QVEVVALEPVEGRLRAGEERGGDGRVGVRDRLVHVARGQAQPLVGGGEGVGGRGVPGGHPAAERAPGERQQDEAHEDRPQLGRGGEQRAVRGRAGRRPGGAGGGRSGPVRGGAAALGGKRGGHEPISAICCSPMVTRALGSGWKPTVSTYFAWFPAVMTHCRKALISLALAASGCLDLTTAYS